MALLDDVITYLEMREPPTAPRIPAPLGKLALMRVENCTVSFYRYLYETVGTPWLWYQRRLFTDAALAAELAKPTTEIFVLYVGGLPAGYFELDAARPPETELCYFGLIPDFIYVGCGRCSRTRLMTNSRTCAAWGLAGSAVLLSPIMVIFLIPLMIGIGLDIFDMFGEAPFVLALCTPLAFVLLRMVSPRAL